MRGMNWFQNAHAVALGPMPMRPRLSVLHVKNCGVVLEYVGHDSSSIVGRLQAKEFHFMLCASLITGLFTNKYLLFATM